MPETARERLAGLLGAQDERSSSIQLAAKAPHDLRLEVDGVGRITLPVPADQARRLCQLGRPARFGRGEETLADPAVRDTWEIPLELVHAEWPGARGLVPDLEAVRAELGLPAGRRLTAELHSLLVYRKGQFFLPHQDSEKDDAMIATLVVTLPSTHTGGELVVHHLGAATTYRGFDTRISLVAFYTDCRHEVRPVTSGHRIALTYDLLLHGNPADHVPDEATLAEAARHLQEHFTTPIHHPYRDTTGEPPHRLAFLLDHEYTEHGLAWPRLKGSDAHRAWLLRAAADAGGLETVLALTEIKETWDAYPRSGDDDRHPSRGYRQWDEDFDDDLDDEDLEDDDQTAGDDTRYQLNDLIDSSIRLTWWTGPSDAPGHDISLDLTDAEVCAVTPSATLPPYSSEYEGYMGNYGNTLDRWYRRAAVLVWPRDRAFANRAQASPSWALKELSAAACSQDPAARRADAASLAPFWDRAVRGQERPGYLLAQALVAAAAVDDPQAGSMLLRPFTIEALRARHAASLVGLADRYGQPWAGDLLRAWYGTGQAWTPGHGLSRDQWLTALPELCQALQDAGDPGTPTAHLLLERAWASLAQRLSTCAASASVTLRQTQLAHLGQPLAAVTSAATATQAHELADQIVGHCQQHGDELTGCVLPALRAALALPGGAPQDGAFARLAADQAAWLRARQARPPRAGDNWAISLPGGCACGLCHTLGSFLADPARIALEWPLAKDRRSHVHSRLDQADLPVTHQTRHKGSPHVLVLTKTTQLFTRETQQRARDQADLDWLLEHWPSTPDEAPGA